MFCVALRDELCNGFFKRVNIKHNIISIVHYIYCRRCLNSVPTLKGLIVGTRRVSNIELHIGREKNKLLTHFLKKEKLINALIK